MAVEYRVSDRGLHAEFPRNWWRRMPLGQDCDSSDIGEYQRRSFSFLGGLNFSKSVDVPAKFHSVGGDIIILGFAILRGSRN